MDTVQQIIYNKDISSYIKSQTPLRKLGSVDKKFNHLKHY